MLLGRDSSVFVWTYTIFMYLLSIGSGANVRLRAALISGNGKYIKFDLVKQYIYIYIYVHPLACCLD